MYRALLAPEQRWAAAILVVVVFGAAVSKGPAIIGIVSVAAHADAIDDIGGGA